MNVRLTAVLSLNWSCACTCVSLIFCHLSLYAATAAALCAGNHCPIYIYIYKILDNGSLPNIGLQHGRAGLD